jgi:vancomycin resistance protein YoaR
VDATLRLNGTDVTATPSQVGRTVNILATLRQLEATILSFGTGAEVTLIVEETPPRVWDAEAAARKARAALSGPVLLVADGQGDATLGPWTANTGQIAQLLKPVLLENGDGTFTYDVTLDMDVFSGFLETLAPGLITLPRNARYNFDEDSGQLVVIEAGVNGRSLDVRQTLARMEQAVFNTESRVVPMAFEYTLPEFNDSVTAAELGITELVSQATTYYNGSTEPRRINIAEAASRFDGVIVKPGEQFSFNALVGDISPEDGFVEGAVIAGGRTVKGVGGGVCQVSTTAFQAAFYAGYPILERYPHAYRVRFYEQGEGVGMDAAIFTPELDFRFLNDTPYHLLIETTLVPEQTALQFRFYSTNPGRQVIKEGPVITAEVGAAPTIYEVNPDLRPGVEQQVDWAAPGADVTITRRVLNASGDEIRRDTFFSHYLPWAAVVQVAPGDPRATVAG